MEIRYDLNDVQKKRLRHWHYHGDAQDTKRFEMINNKTRELAEMIMRMTPHGRNQSLALTALEDVRMRANAAIAVEESMMREESEE